MGNFTYNAGNSPVDILKCCSYRIQRKTVQQSFLPTKWNGMRWKKRSLALANRNNKKTKVDKQIKPITLKTSSGWKKASHFESNRPNKIVQRTPRFGPLIAQNFPLKVANWVDRETQLKLFSEHCEPSVMLKLSIFWWGKT